MKNKDKPVGSKTACVMAYKNNWSDERNKLKIQVFDDLMKGNQRHLIIDKLLTKGYDTELDFTPQAAQDFYAKIRRDMRKLYEDESKEDLKNQIVGSFFDVYREARQLKDLKSSIACLKEISALLGVYDQPNAVNGNQPIVISFGFNNNDNNDKTDVVDYEPDTENIE